MSTAMEIEGSSVALFDPKLLTLLCEKTLLQQYNAFVSRENFCLDRHRSDVLQYNVQSMKKTTINIYTTPSFGGFSLSRPHPVTPSPVGAPSLL